MTTALLLACGILAQAADETRAAYDREQAAAGRDPSAHVRLALWCEAHGLKAERVKHLALAVLNDPANAIARGLMGMVAYGGRWQQPDAIGEKVKEDARLTAALAEYNGRRERTPETADAQWKLAVWCEEQGLKPEATAHLATVVRLDPSREAAWKRLGYKKVNGRWTTDAQVAAEKAEIEARKKADKLWTPRLAQWRDGLADPKRRDEAEAGIATVSDPYAVPSVWSVFVEGGKGEREHVKAVQMLGQIDAPQASKALAMLSVFSDSAEVRRASIETLRNRDTRDFLGVLIPMLRKRMKYEIRPVAGPGSPGVLFVEGERFNVQRLYSPPPMPNIPLYEGERVTFDADGLPVVYRYLGTGVVSEGSTRSETTYGGYGAAAVAAANKKGINVNRAFRSSSTTSVSVSTETPTEQNLAIPIGQLMLQYRTSALVALRQQQDDVQTVKDYNKVVGRVNDRVLQALGGATGVNLGDDAESWNAWWADQMGYAYKAPPKSPTPTYTEEVPLEYTPAGVPTTVQVSQSGASKTSVNVGTSSFSGGFHHFCFAAGTPVRTLVGPRPIESVKLGDRVLTQNVKSGTLSFQPVLQVFHNRPSPTLRLNIGKETIVTTPIHRFWIPGRGWVMARELKVGDEVRTLDGPSRIASIDEDAVQPVFNLQVAEGSSFFVGSAGMLVHDNSVVEPATSPFDTPAGVATASPTSP